TGLRKARQISAKVHRLTERFKYDERQERCADDDKRSGHMIAKHKGPSLTQFDSAVDRRRQESQHGSTSEIAASNTRPTPAAPVRSPGSRRQETSPLSSSQ